METPDPQPVLRKRRAISPIWTLPVLALALCAWLLYKSFMEAGIEIVVYFDDASGIIPEKTQVMAMGIPFGMVKELTPDIDRSKVRTVIRMDRSTEPYLVEDTVFWIVRPEVSAARITGLETLLSGSYIGVQRGKSEKPAREFTALPTSPPVPDDTPGLHIKLRSSTLRSIQEGSSIYFRNIKVGSVQSYKLEEDESVLIACHILPQYAHLIRTGSRFYDASGVTFSGKLTNLKIRMESIASLLVGGIVVNTPEALHESPRANNGDVFPLYEDFEAANYGIPMTLKLASGANIAEGVTKVMYRGLEAGYVKHININDDAERSVTAHILLDPRASIILRKNTRFWMVSADLSVTGISNVNTLITGSYITFKPGDGEFTDSFEILPEPPVEAPLRPGRRFRLSATDTAFASSGAPVYYRKVKIGEILGSTLNGDRSSVETTIFIYDSFTDIIMPDSVFIKTGGIAIEAGLSGFSFNAEPLAAVIKGGIDVLNPSGNDADPGGAAEAGTLFALFPDYEAALAARPDLKPEGLYLRLNSPELDSYRPGSPIFYKKIKVGHILGFTLQEQDRNVQISCFIEKRYADLVRSSSKFYRTSGVRVRGGLSGVAIETESLESLVAGGIGFYTEPGGSPVSDNQVFPVYESLEASRTADNVLITVRFHNADLLAADAPVKYQGVQIGTVQTVAFDADLKTVRATLSIQPPFETFFRETTRIWLTRPKIDLSGVKNLETVIFGSFVTLQAGSGEITHEFTGLSRPPQPYLTQPAGLNITLEANRLGSLAVGSPVYYRQVKVGEVTGFDLAFDFKGVLIQVAIGSQYAAIVRDNSRFWNVSGLTVTGGLFSGLTVSTPSLEALMAGGIAFATPDGGTTGAPVLTGYRFLLYDDPEDEWLDWKPDILTVTGADTGVPAR